MKQIYTPRSENSKAAKAQAFKDIIEDTKHNVIVTSNKYYDVYSINVKHISMSPKEFVKIYIDS
jgi:hypothetical protein